MTRAAVDEDEEEERGFVVDAEAEGDLASARRVEEEKCESEGLASSEHFDDSGEPRDLPEEWERSIAKSCRDAFRQ